MTGQEFVYGLGTQYAHWLKTDLGQIPRDELAALVAKV